MYMDIFENSVFNWTHSPSIPPAVTSPFTGHARAGVNRKQVLYCCSWLLSYRKYSEQLLLLSIIYVTGTRTGTEKLSSSLRSYNVHAIFVITSTVCCYCGSYHRRTWTVTEAYQGQFGHLKVFSLFITTTKFIKLILPVASPKTALHVGLTHGTCYRSLNVVSCKIIKCRILMHNSCWHRQQGQQCLWWVDHW